MAISEDHELSIDAAPSAAGDGFVGVVTVGDAKVFRTMTTYPTRDDALAAAQAMAGGALQSMLAAQEWRETTGDAPGVW